MNTDNYSFKTIGTIEVGGISHHNLIHRCEKSGVLFTGWGMEILERIAHLRDRFPVEIVSGILPFGKLSDKDGALRRMIETGLKGGLCLCPVSTGPELLLQNPPGFLNDAYLAMKPVLCSTTGLGHEQENILTIEDRKSRDYSGRRISGAPACIDGRAIAGITYLFCRRNHILVKEGFISLAA